MPCEGITVDCTNSTDFTRGCELQYDLDVESRASILSDDASPVCYWMNIGELYHADCVGTCEDATIDIYSTYNLIFNLSLAFKETPNSTTQSNETESFLICDENFRTANDIDDAFSLALDAISTDEQSTLHAVLEPPKTWLSDGSTFVECANEPR